jgi:hypothetical protein
MEVPSESFKGELGIEEPVILCEPRILTVNQWLVIIYKVVTTAIFYSQRLRHRNSPIKEGRQGNSCYIIETKEKKLPSEYL